MRATLIVCGAVGSLIVAVLVCARVAGYRQSEELKPYMTYKRLLNSGLLCGQYKAEYGTWPTSIDEVVPYPWSEDGWQREIILVPYSESTGYGEVISYGRDGEPGGTGLNRDIVIRYPLAANSAWNARQTNGLPNPLVFNWDFDKSPSASEK